MTAPSSPPARRDGIEWRVEWRRVDWLARTGDKSRRFARRDDLDRFVRRLRSGDRPELSPLKFVRISWRHVGTWQNGSPP